MKFTSALFLAALASATAFAPSQNNDVRISSELSAFKSPFAPKAKAPEPKKKQPFSFKSSASKKTAEKKKAFFENVFGLDLFAPNPTINEYGARSKKNLKQGKITPGKSYVPSGLTASQYAKVRKEQEAKKAANYKKNVAKAGKFQDYTDFYLKRGTDIASGWKKSVTLGHTMAKTKYDWSGDADKKLWAKTK